MTKSKRKNVRTLLILIVVLLLFIAAYAMVLSHKAKKSSDDKDKAEVKVSELNADKATKLSFTNKDGSMTLVKEKDIWHNESDRKAPINQTYIQSMVSSLASINADKILTDDAANLSEYGLDKPSVVAELTCEDGSSVSVEIGDSLVVGGGNYVKLADSNTIYVVGTSLYTAFDYTMTKLLAIEDFPSITATNVTSIDVDSKDGEDFSAWYDNEAADRGDYYAWNITKPFSWNVKGDPQKLETYFGNYGSIAFSECVDYDCKDLSKYGLDNPSTTIDLAYYTQSTEVEADSADKDGSASGDASTATSENSAGTANTANSSTDTTNGTTSDADASSANGSSDSSDKEAQAKTTRTDYKLTLKIGNKTDEGDYYVMMMQEGLKYPNAVYKLPESSVTTLAPVKAFDNVSPLISLIDITSLDHLDVEVNGTKYTMSVIGKKSKNDDGEEETQYTYKLNGNELKEEDFKNVYQEVIGLSTTAEITKKVNDNTPVITMTFVRNSKDLKDVTVNYLPYDGTNFYRVEVDGQITFLAEKQSVDKVTEAIKDLGGKK
ncbi:MAG TPA: DUF4340 domain-containing protein [Lachnospiraceae bacterium]|nr:DUF4340 domain-containing protein [Lachnospiraceae bacterium]